MKNKSLFTMLGIGVFAVGALTACGTNNTSNTSKQNTTSNGQSTSTTTKSNPITLKMILWSNAPTVKAIQDINRRFHKLHPNITIKEVNVPTNHYPQLEQTRLRAKNVDIVANPAFTNETRPWTSQKSKPTWQEWLDQGMFVKLDGQKFVKNYLPTAEKQASTYKGHVYGIETGSVGIGVFYNESIFKKYKLQPPTTWSQFIHICNVLKAHHVAPLIMGGKDKWPQTMPGQSIFASLFSNAATEEKNLWLGKAKFTDPGMVKVATRLSQLWSYAKPGWLGVGYNEATTSFAQGQAAMLPDGTWDLPTIQKANPKLKFGFFTIPNDTAGANDFLVGKYDLQWLLPASSTHKAAVQKWMAFFSEPKNYQQFVSATGFIPTQPGAKYSATGTAAKDIMKLDKHFKLTLGQVVVGRQGVQPGQPGDIPGSWTLLKPEGNLSPQKWAQQSQGAWNSTENQNKN